jgi:O-acetylserine/cysteine efflux transporter
VLRFIASSSRVVCSESPRVDLLRKAVSTQNGRTMRARHMALAAATSIIWGLGFAAGKFGLESFSPAQLTAARFLIACLPVMFIPRPRLAWSSIVLIGATLFTGQFLFMFFAFEHGLPPGLASVTQQMQAFFTVLLAAIFLGDVPTRRQAAGMTMALVGLLLIASSAGGDLRLIGLGLGLAAAFSWAIGNVLVKRAADVPVFPLVVWCSLVPPIPALVISIALDGRGFAEAVFDASWRSLGGVVYLGVFATVLAYGAWGYLLQRYPTGAVAPFALISPCTGVVAAAAIFGEIPGPLRYAGMALILGGLCVAALPVGGILRASMGRNAP